MRIVVAGIVIKLDIPDKFLREEIYQFRCDESLTVDVVIEAADEPFPVFPEFLGEMPPVHHVHRADGYKYYLFSNDDDVSFIKYDNNYSRFIINMRAGGNEEAHFIETVNSALRRIFVMLIAAKGGVSLHSSTVGYCGEAICFSASSGTGKTTHTKLWQKHIADVEILNGDNGYIFLHHDRVYFYSAPWCGTSGDLIKAKASVKALIFLSQARENALAKLEIPEAFMRLLTGCFLPVWDKELYLMTLDIIEKMASLVDCRHLQCLPNEEAVRMVYHGIYQC